MPSFSFDNLTTTTVAATTAFSTPSFYIIKIKKMSTSTATTVVSLIYILLSISGATAAGHGSKSASSPNSAPAPSPSHHGAGGRKGGGGGGGKGESFMVEGKVYCDPCRIQFPTKISYPVPNAKVTLSCRERENSAETVVMEATSDSNGMYNITASGDHEEEICEVSVKESPDKKCPEVMDDDSNSRVSLTDKNGVRGKTRIANPIGFMAKDIDPRCKDILAELGIMVY
ncbi:hypothetical protein OSB04_023024 [Centaurea solstitialis]|uniref:Uncharacterized protein n=1 Tax=Centaurea solstitialis TaxID=347529 RepID=A0AA38W1W4_9ASTR|nr:hypothetical protein OSB04_023024 [Centaurea solstitialis]